jgi:hypothetical protein
MSPAVTPTVRWRCSEPYDGTAHPITPMKWVLLLVRIRSRWTIKWKQVPNGETGVDERISDNALT